MLLIAQNKDNDGLKRLGGVEGLAKALGSSTTTGLDPSATGDASIEAHAQAFGDNRLPQTEPESFFALVGILLCWMTDDREFLHMYFHLNTRRSGAICKIL